MKTRILSLFILTTVAACAADTSSSTQENMIEIAGTWVSPFPNAEGDTDEVITNATWTDPNFSAEIVEYDNEANVAITQNPADAEFSPNAFNRVVWTEPTANSVFYCSVEFGLATLERARNSTATADDSDPAAGGCGMFPWTRLSR